MPVTVATCLRIVRSIAPSVRPTLELSCEAPLCSGFVSFNSLLGGLVVAPHRSVRSGNAVSVHCRTDDRNATIDPRLQGSVHPSELS
jgi:hypothetical protein